MIKENVEYKNIEQYFNSDKACHIVGIGGVSMSPLAEILRGQGITVTGSDVGESQAITDLRELGISVNIGHAAENIQNAGYIIRTAAAREDNIEISTARALGIPVFERAQAWGYIMKGYKNAICVSGVHGKTTTTSMVTHILFAAKTDPTIMIGGSLPLLGSGYRLGKGDIIALESCEYYNSYHHFFPTIAVVLNIDADHLDFFNDLDDLKSSFRKFASLVPEDGYIVCNADDANTMESLSALGRELFTFGLDKDARVRGINMRASGWRPKVDVLLDGKPFCKIKLRIPGVHNIRNALGATAAAIAAGIPAKAIERGLYGYSGVSRRFEYKGSYNGAEIYIDYAHHPKELRALIDTVSSLDYSRVILAFQPHTFSRTRALFSDFVTELSRIDIAFLAEIYAARELDDLNVSSGDLADAIPGAQCCGSFYELADQIAGIARDGDIILFVGAGDICTVGDMLAGRDRDVV